MVSALCFLMSLSAGAQLLEILETTFRKILEFLILFALPYHLLHKTVTT